MIVSGCLRYTPEQAPPISYYLDSSKDLKMIGRTALVELENDVVVHPISSDLTDAIFQEIQKQQLFGMTKIDRDDPALRILKLEMNSRFTPDQLIQIRKKLKADAVLVGEITGYQPYPHMSLSLRLRMIDLMDGKLLWAMEQTWNTTDKTTQDRICEYYNPKRLVLHEENLGGQLGIVSSLKFFKFVAHEVTETLLLKEEEEEIYL